MSPNLPPKNRVTTWKRLAQAIKGHCELDLSESRRTNELIASLLDRDEENTGEDQPLITESQRILQVQGLDSEIEYNESLIAEREDDIKEIEKSIVEVNEIFRDLGTMVNEQQYMLGR